jgi:hypothetical protein
MRSTLLLSALAGLAVAAPRPVPQDIDIDIIEKLPEPSVLGPAVSATQQLVSYTPSAILSSIVAEVSAVATDSPSKVKRAVTCSPQPTG